jgi:hypothetical protein
LYWIFFILLFGIALLIRLVIVPALRRSSAASNLSLFQHHLAGLQPPFALNPDETVLLAQVGRDLGAVRSVVSESPTEDSYPGCFPLVYCSSQRLVVLMSTTDRPTAITGVYPVRQPDLHQRIGEQFEGSNGRFVSSASWRWETIGMVVAEDSEVGLSWTDRDGVAAVLLSFVNPSDRIRFVDQAIALIRERRSQLTLVPEDPETVAEGAQTTFTFANALVTCSTCSTSIATGDRYCTGCGAPVTRMEHV